MSTSPAAMSARPASDKASAPLDARNTARCGKLRLMPSASQRNVRALE
jgi:hypothetical protein